MPITAYCLDWHITNSNAFVDILVEPLKPYADIKLKAWDGERLPKFAEVESLLIFCMLPPPPKLLAGHKGKIVWIPMWDQAQGYDQQWWNSLPKNVHVVAFSQAIYQRAKTAGLPTLKLQYCLDPQKFRPASWHDGYTIFYWNRTGLVGPQFLEKLCQTVGAKKLIFRGQIDPRINSQMAYKLPSKLGNTQIENLEDFTKSPKKYLSAVAAANIFVSPRKSEGVGLTFLEAMSKGCGVIAYDAPTMNEYIKNGYSGLLLNNQPPTGLRQKIQTKIFKSSTAPVSPYLLSDQQSWNKIAKVNFKKLGVRARTDQAKGYSKWQSSIKDYAQFVLN